MCGSIPERKQAAADGKEQRGATGGLIMPKLLNVSVHLAPLGSLQRLSFQKHL